MGAWGIGNFENDEAADWICELESSEGMELLADALRATAAEDYLEAPDCTLGLAAAEVVSALIGYPATDLPDEVTSWLVGRSLTPDDPLVDEARAAVTRIAEESELAELWRETDDFDEWKSVVDDLRLRLGAD